VTEDDARASREVREVTGRAIKRLEVLGWVILFVAAALALLAGALAAYLLEAAFGLPFRPTWAVCALALFVIPALASHAREKRLERGLSPREGPTRHPRTADGRREEADAEG